MAWPANRRAARADHAPDRRPRPRNAVLNAREPARQLRDLRVADLFAGSGALGLEALSRGATSATFVESDPKAAATIRRNADKLGASIHLLSGSALSLPRSEPFDLIFTDAPYAADSGTAVVTAVLKTSWLAHGGWMSVETSRDEEVDPGELLVEASRVVGRARLTLLRRA
jgi:N6-adenine-specific methylase